VTKEEEFLDFYCKSTQGIFNKLFIEILLSLTQEGHEFQMRDVNLEVIDYYILTGKMPSKE